MDDKVTTLEKLFLALADRTRLRLLSLMADGEVAVGYLAEQIGESQPKVSRHLAYLRNAGLVSTRRDGKWIFYSITPQGDRASGNILGALLENLGPDGADRKPAYSTKPAADPILDLRDQIALEKADDIAAASSNWHETREEMEIFLL